jgi:hypothetical protein
MVSKKQQKLEKLREARLNHFEPVTNDIPELEPEPKKVETIEDLRDARLKHFENPPSIPSLEPQKIVGKTKREPSAYNLFIKKTIPVLKAANDALGADKKPHTDLMKQAAKLWKEQK